MQPSESNPRASAHRTKSDHLLLDVRGPDEFATGHLQDALNIPVDQLAQRLAELGPKSRPIGVYCRSGRRSARAVELLRRAGFQTVVDLGGQRCEPARS